MAQFRFGVAHFAEPRQNTNTRMRVFKPISPLSFLCPELPQYSLEGVQFDRIFKDQLRNQCTYHQALQPYW